MTSREQGLLWKDVTADLAQTDIPWQNIWVMAYTQYGREIPEGVTVGWNLATGRVERRSEDVRLQTM